MSIKKYLENTNWKPQIQHFCNKMAKTILAGHILNNETLELLPPYLNCCVLIWGNTNKSSLKKYAKKNIT